MSDRYIPVKDHQAVRDSLSGAILFTDDRALKQAILRRKLREENLRKDEAIQRLTSGMEQMKKQMSDLVKMISGEKNADTK